MADMCRISAAGNTVLIESARAYRVVELHLPNVVFVFMVVGV